MIRSETRSNSKLDAVERSSVGKEFCAWGGCTATGCKSSAVLGRYAGKGEIEAAAPPSQARVNPNFNREKLTLGYFGKAGRGPHNLFLTATVRAAHSISNLSANLPSIPHPVLGLLAAKLNKFKFTMTSQSTISSRSGSSLARVKLEVITD
ncbi:hypothetical protein C8R46DRAFT_1043961 [Mycena filopes]|nr:hypothetical protein C8R46DRAFT_1043957 [Mycena filopes]KAJ7149996.1 hypothetical protein C8R46DRAFT_1043961 [Mycena filopes]